MSEHDEIATWVAALVRRAQARAWNEGYASGHSNAMRRMSDEPNAPATPNPYTTTAARDGQPESEGQ